MFKSIKLCLLFSGSLLAFASPAESQNGFFVQVISNSANEYVFKFCQERLNKPIKCKHTQPITDNLPHFVAFDTDKTDKAEIPLNVFLKEVKIIDTTTNDTNDIKFPHSTTDCTLTLNDKAISSINAKGFPLLKITYETLITPVASSDISCDNSRIHWEEH